MKFLRQANMSRNISDSMKTASVWVHVLIKEEIKHKKEPAGIAGGFLFALQPLNFCHF